MTVSAFDLARRWGMELTQTETGTVFTAFQFRGIVPLGDREDRTLFEMFE